MIYDVISPSGLQCSRIARTRRQAIADVRALIPEWAAKVSAWSVSPEVEDYWRLRVSEVHQPPTAWRAERQPLRQWPGTLWKIWRHI